jgi:hypothetical protein
MLMLTFITTEKTLKGVYANRLIILLLDHKNHMEFVRFTCHVINYSVTNTQHGRINDIFLELISIMRILLHGAI